MGSKIILFELNEVPAKVLESYLRWRPAGFLAQTLRRCNVYSTFTEDKRLCPWTTWPTLHRGVVDQNHTIHHFGQDLGDIDRDFPPVWQILASAGVSTGVFGSLHTYPVPKVLENYSFFVPDTFAAGSECFPKNVESFQDFNLAMARDSARTVDTRIHWAPALRFLAQAPNLGLKFKTVVDIGGQLISERLQSWRKIRRRTYQAVLAFDVFMKLLESTRPSFSTFFTNHVASSQHRYWAAVFPGDYERNDFPEEWISTYRNEIDFTMSRFEMFFERLVAFVNRNPDHSIWVTTSMGQEATETRLIETELAVGNIGKFAASLGLKDGEWEERPAMIPQRNIMVNSIARDAFRDRLSKFRVNGDPVEVDEREAGFFSVSLGHTNLHETGADIQIDGSRFDIEQVGLEFKKIDDKCGATAYHIPQGLLFTYDPKIPGSGSCPGEISTRQIVPEILRNYGLSVPDYMERERGLSLARVG